MMVAVVISDIFDAESIMSAKVDVRVRAFLNMTVTLDQSQI